MRLRDQNEAEYCLGPVSIRSSSDCFVCDKHYVKWVTLASIKFGKMFSVNIDEI